MMQKVLRLTVFSIFGLLGLVLILAFLAALLISLPPGERYVKNILQTRLENLFDQQVRIGALETNILSRVRIENLRIFRETPDRGIIPLLNVKSATLNFTIWELLERKFTLRSIRASELFVNIETDAEGNTNFPDFGPKDKAPAEPGPLEFSLRNITVENSVFHYGDMTIPLDTVLRGIEGTLTNRGKEGYRFEVTADSLRFSYEEGILAGTDLVGAGRWVSGRLLADEIRLQLPDAVLTADDFMYRSAGDDRVSGHFTLAGKPDAAMEFLRAAFSPSIPKMDGEVDLRVDLSQPEGIIRIGYALTSPRLRITDLVSLAPLVVDDALVVGVWSGNIVVVDTVYAGTLGGTISGSGALQTDNVAARDAFFEFQRLDARQVTRFLGLTNGGYSGRVSGWVSANGIINNLGALDATLAMEINRPAFRGRPAPDLAGYAILKRGMLDARVAGAQLLARVNTNVSRPGLNGAFVAEIDQLSDIAPIFGITDLYGSVYAEGTLGGELSSPRVTATVVSDSISYANFPVNYLRGGVAYRDGEVTFSDVQAIGAIDSLSALRPPLHVDSLLGNLKYTVEVNGPLSALRGETLIESDRLAYGGIRFNTASVHAFVQGDTIRVERAVMAQDSLRFETTGIFDYTDLAGTATIDIFRTAKGGDDPGRFFAAFDLGENRTITARVRGESLSAELLRLSLPNLSDVGGELSFSGEVEGSLDNPRVHINFGIQRPRFRTFYLDSLRGEAALRNGTVTLDSLRLYRDEFYSVSNGSLQLTDTPGFYTITSDSEISLDARGEGLRLSWLKDEVPGVRDITGRASYDITLNGTVGNPSPGGAAYITGFSLNSGGGAPPIRDTNIQATVEDEYIILAMTDGTLLQQPFALNARINYTPPGYGGDIDLLIAGERVLNVSGTIADDQIQATALVDSLNLSVLRAFIPNLEQISGIMNADLKITGTTKSPRPDGFLNIRNLSLDVPGVDMPLRNGFVDIRISPDQVVVDTLVVRSRNGTIQVTGSIQNIMSGTATGQLQARINNILVQRKNEFSILINNAQLTYSKTGAEYYLLKGQVGLGETRFLYDLTIDDIIRRMTAPRRPGEPPPAIYRQTRLDVILDGGERIFIDNNLADIRLRADLQLIGTLTSPVVLGTVTAVEGEIYYLDREFKIVEGAVEFADRSQMNPRLDIQAESTVTSFQAFGGAKYTITLTLTGTMQKPDFALSSNPPLDRPNIISLL
ncbi:MAG: translocation/assembly module TamB domain-containing protein, partial [Candidatus Latescibacterota bacterium]